MSEMNETSPIYHLKIYQQITPIFLISLGTLYISIIIFRYIKWRYNKRKARKMRIDRRKLENFWRKRSIYLNSRIQKPTQTYDKSFDSNATLVNVQEKSITPNHYQFNQPKPDLFQSISNKLDLNYQQKKRRQQLLWQWSVSMGYCRYNHAHDLNLLIDRLLEHDSHC